MTFTILTDLRRHFEADEADLMKAAAATLNSTVFEARRQIIEHEKRVLDRPRSWSTDKAWLFDKAKVADGARMAAVLRAKPEQAKVLGFQIDGGDRKKGDVGATRYDVPVGVADRLEDQHGGMARGVLKKTAKAAKTEKAKRQALAQRRSATRVLRNAAPSEKVRARTAARLKPLKWVVKSKNEAGTFFGTIGGVRGYWQRPGRTEAATTRRKGLRTVLPRGSNAPELLIAFTDVARYRRKPVKYDTTMYRAQTAKMTTANFGRELARIQAARSRP